jgi:membrane protein required for colicin V production
MRPLLYNPRRAPSAVEPAAMNITDYLVIAVIIISAIVGSVRGFLREAIALVTWVIALFIAWHFSDLIAPQMGGLLAGSNVRTWAARVILVALVLLLGAGIGASVSHFVRLSIFSGMDRFLGFVFGALRGFMVLGVFVILGQLLRLDGERWWHHSLLIPYGESIANGLRVLVGEPSVRHMNHVTARA